MSGRAASMAFWWIFTVAGAHALAFLIVQVLPGSALTVLGISWVNPEARSAFLVEHAERTYLGTLVDLLQLDLGHTLNGTPVSTELGQAAMAGLPRLAAALILVVLTIGLVTSAPERWLARLAKAASALAFFPPFLAPFVAVSVLLLLSPEYWDTASWSLSAVAIAFPAAALAGAQAAQITERNLKLPFAVALRAAGYSASGLRRRLLWNLTVEIMPSLEKIALGLFSAALFAEVVMGQDGLGAVTMRAIRRSDTNLVLAVVLLFAATTSTLRILSELVRARAGALPE